jgi:hypothetical protein
VRHEKKVRFVSLLSSLVRREPRGGTLA